MNWICPNCGKSFRNTNQTHSCAILTVEDHLMNKPGNIIEIFEILINKISEFGEYEVNPVKSSIQFKKGSTFASMKIKKNMIILEFILPYVWDEFPVNNILRASGKRVYHAASIYEKDDIGTVLLDKLRESYDLIKGN